ncbi:hypothetical protein [Rahnella sikkimica]|uniref:Uncharacterized protein n=1 Tax=Rahnella sikkimica TaxID=1805933 RepID=A0A2L1UMU0_9GAMM|nr:hypothetical protein [Rahnella sikkimica]AVF34244.1 hypothetical protein BV494_04535 [Rahnella sikkimica]
MSEVIRYNCETLFDGGVMNQAGDGDYVEYADYLSQLQQTDALQTSLNNIINAFGIKGEGAHSKLVIEYVHRLVAENVAMRGAIKFAEPWLPSCDGELLHIISQAKITPATDGAIAEIGAKAVEDEFSRTPDAEIKWDGTNLTVQNVRDGFSFGVTPVFVAANLRAGRKG